MNEDDRKREEALEGNIGQLLSRTEPELELPREARQRVLDALKRDARPRRSSGRLVAWSTGAAAVLIFALFAFWPGGFRRTGIASQVYSTWSVIWRMK